MRKWFTSKEAKKITGIILILCVTLIVQIISFFSFNQKLYDMSLEHSMHQVEELSVFVEKNLQLEVERYIHILQVIGSQLEDAETMGVQGVVDKLSKAHDISQFKMLGVSDLDGNGVNSAGSQYDISYEGIREQIQRDKVYISNVLKDNHETLIFIGVPLKINDKICGIVWGKYVLTDLLKNMEFNDDGYKYFQIIDDKGHYLLCSNNKFTLGPKQQSADETIWDEMEEYQYANGMSAQKIYEMVQKRESGVFYFEGNGQGRYVNYRPLKINNWYLFSVQVSDELHTYVYRTRQTAVHLFTIFTIGLLIIFGAIYNLIYTMYKRIVKQNREMQAINGMFQATLQQTKNIPFAIDYKLQQIVLYGYPTKEVNQYCTFDDMRSENMLKKGLLDPESLEEYEKFYQSVLVQKEKCDPVIIYSRLGKNMEWLRISITSDSSEDGDQMIGVLENYGEHKKKDLKIEKHSDNIKKIEKKSQTDFLTSLYNREAFIERIRPALEENEQKKQICALMILDLDHFKEVNDCMGHGMGDIVLQHTANTLSSFFRKGDLVGRLGGDEFVIFVENVGNVKAFEGRIEELNRILCKTYHKNGESVQVSASIGVMLTNEKHTTFEELYEKADQALYQVKRATRNGYHIYSKRK